MTLVVHPHFHRRRTGATAHVEAVVPALGAEFEARAMGPSLVPQTPRIAWRTLLSRLRREPLIWHAHRNNELFVGLLLRLFGKRVRVVFTRHASLRPSWLTRVLAVRSDRVVSLTRVVARELGLPSTVVAHGVDLTRFAPPADRSEAWQKLGLPGRYGIGVVGRIRPDKGQGDFVAALAPLSTLHPEWHAVLVGLTKANEQAWAEGLRQSMRASLSNVGEQREIVPWYRGLTILVHPSYQEAHSLVLLEALASGCCVVATRLEHHPEIIEHGRTGFLYAPGDVNALRDILADLLANPLRAAEIGRQAAEEARARFGIEQEVRQLASLYRSLLEAPAA